MEIYAIYTAHDLRPIGKGLVRDCIGLHSKDSPVFDKRRKEFISQYEVAEINLDRTKELVKENPLLEEDFKGLLN